MICLSRWCFMVSDGDEYIRTIVSIPFRRAENKTVIATAPDLAAVFDEQYRKEVVLKKALE